MKEGKITPALMNCWILLWLNSGFEPWAGSGEYYERYIYVYFIQEKYKKKTTDTYPRRRNLYLGLEKFLSLEVSPGTSFYLFYIN